jgi:tetratricopeptide (TPR) repeat protein
LIASYYLGEFSLPRAALACTFRSVVLFAGYNLVLGAISGRTDNAAHVGGLVSGLALGALIARVAPESEALARRFAILLFGAVIVATGAMWLQHSRSYIIHATRGRELFERNRTTEAIAEFQRSIRERSDFLPAHFALANAYLRQGQFDAAEAELNRLLQIQPQVSWNRYQLGVVYLKQKRTQQARDVFAHLISKYPDDSDAHFGMGMVLAAEENHPAAIDEYKTAAKLEESELGGLYYHLGLSYGKLKMYDQAIEAYRREQDENGDDYETELALANAYQAKGMQQQASDALQRAAQLKSGQ